MMSNHEMAFYEPINFQPTVIRISNKSEIVRIIFPGLTITFIKKRWNLQAEYTVFSQFLSSEFVWTVDVRRSTSI